MDRESYAPIITEIHSSLERKKFDNILEIIKKIKSKTEMDDLSQFFLLTYHYNFKSKFLEKADFDYCMKFSDLLNKRIH